LAIREFDVRPAQNAQSITSFPDFPSFNPPFQRPALVQAGDGNRPYSAHTYVLKANSDLFDRNLKLSVFREDF
jgi:hypothetical protein